jgi:outer membrane protein
MKILSAGVFLLLAAAAPFVQSQPSSLSLEEAVRLALLNDPGVESANWDWLATSAKADAADMRKLPSLMLAAGYQRLSELPASSFDMPNPSGPGTITFSLPESLSNIFTTSVNLQYPVFSGFRIRETASLARLQVENKQLALEMVKRSLIFEVRRAYWEAVRAADNVLTLQKNLEFLGTSQKLTADQASLGTATQADLLTAEMRYQQAQIDLVDGESMQKRTSLLLASLIGGNDPAQPLALATQPGNTTIAVPEAVLVEGELIERALSHRAECLSASISIQMAERNAKIVKAALLPTVALTGNLTFADPNPRVAFQTDPWLFVGTWSLGLQISYDLGGFPSNRLESQAQFRTLEKSRADLLKQQKAIVLDVRTCLLSLERARRDLALIQGIVQQGEETARVMHLRYNAGSATNLDVLSAELALLRAKFAVTNRQIDVQIAAADLARAAALDELN